MQSWPIKLNPKRISFLLALVSVSVLAVIFIHGRIKKPTQADSQHPGNIKLASACLPNPTDAPVMMVYPFDGIKYESWYGTAFVEGGTQSIGSYTVYAANSNIGWTATSDADWLNITSGGTSVPKTGAKTIDVSLNDKVRFLKPGKYTAAITMTNSTNGIGNTKRLVEFTLPDINGESAFMVVGGEDLEGPPKQTGEFLFTTYYISNWSYKPKRDIKWHTEHEDWLDVMPSSGTIGPYTGLSLPSGIKVSFNEKSLALPVGLHESKLTFVNETDGTKVEKNVRLAVNDDLPPRNTFLPCGENFPGEFATIVRIDPVYDTLRSGILEFEFNRTAIDNPIDPRYDDTFYYLGNIELDGLKPQLVDRESEELTPLGELTWLSTEGEVYYIHRRGKDPITLDEIVTYRVTWTGSGGDRSPMYLPSIASIKIPPDKIIFGGRF